MGLLIGVGMAMITVYSVIGLVMLRGYRRLKALGRNKTHYVCADHRRDGSVLWTCGECTYEVELTEHGLQVFNSGDVQAWHSEQGTVCDPKLRPWESWVEQHEALLEELDSPAGCV